MHNVVKRPLVSARIYFAASVYQTQVREYCENVKITVKITRTRMDLTATKAVVLVLLGLIKLCSGLAPIVFTKILKRKSDRFLKKFIGKFARTMFYKHINIGLLARNISPPPAQTTRFINTHTDNTPQLSRL